MVVGVHVVPEILYEITSTVRVSAVSLTAKHCTDAKDILLDAEVAGLSIIVVSDHKYIGIPASIAALSSA